MPNGLAGILGLPEQGAIPPAAPVQPEFAAATGQLPPGADLARPATTPAEVEQRKAGWQAVAEKINNNPNLMRALGFAGASLLQSAGAGESTLGGAGRAFAVGQSAFESGEFAEQQAGLERSKEARAAAETAATVEGRRATTQQTQVQTGVLSATAQARIDRERKEVEKLSLELDTLKDEAGLKKMETELKKRRAQIEKELPDSVLRNSLIASLGEAEAKLAKTKADTAKTRAEAGVGELTLDVLKKMPEEERKQFLTKTGKFSTSALTSGIVQQASLWGDLFDKLAASKPDHPAVKGKTREEFQMTQLQSAKAKDITDMMKNYVLAGGDDESILADFSKLLQQNLAQRQGVPGAAAPAAGAVQWQDAGLGMEFRIKLGGTREWRRKAAPTQSPATINPTDQFLVP